LSRKPTRRTPTTVEQHVARELDEIVADPNSGLTILERLAAPPSGHPQVTITLDTSTIPAARAQAAASRSCRSTTPKSSRSFSTSIHRAPLT